MSTARARQKSVSRAMNRTGRPGIIVPNGISYGIQSKLVGNETGAVTVKGKWKSTRLVFPRNPYEAARFADEERGAHREWFFSFAAISIGFVPSIDDRVLEPVSGVTYAVIKVDQVCYGEAVIEWVYVLRPV